MNVQPPAGYAWLKAFEAEVRAALPLSDVGVPLLCAQAALESGWGAARPWRKGFNFGNVTHRPGDGWTGDSWVELDADDEYYHDEHGVLQKRRISQCWRIYPTVRAALENHWQLLGRPRYVLGRMALERGDLGDFCHQLGPYAGRGKGGYFTLPELEYRRRLAGVLAVVTKYLAFTPTP
jgi:flagellum-specific peptidoglycan hydrolase FlgJ